MSARLVLQQPVIPWSISWLPYAVASSPQAFSTSMVGRRRNRPEFGGEAPTLSPAERGAARRASGGLFVEQRRQVGRPSDRDVACRPSPWSSGRVGRGNRSSRSPARSYGLYAIPQEIEETPLGLLRLGDPHQVGDRRGQIEVRMPFALPFRKRIALPPARNVERMLMLASKSGHRGHILWPKKADAPPACRAWQRRTGTAGGEGDHIARAVGWAMSAVLSGPLGI